MDQPKETLILKRLQIAEKRIRELELKTNKLIREIQRLQKLR